MTYCSYCMSPIQTTYKVCPYCGKSVHAEVSSHHLLPGTILNGKILVGAVLGEGGFGITYIGRDLNLDLKVAIKEFYPNGYVNRSNALSPDITFSVSDDGRDFFAKGKERFMREARILAKFSSEPGVVEVRDFFEEHNTAYIVMEYLDGEDLKAYLKRNGPMKPGEALELLLPVMKTLQKIHDQGLIHRDISPDNIRMSNRGTKLLDFGAARDVSVANQKSLSVMLKPGYAPEEQYRSKGEQGPWTDVYALCATMYSCITGNTPDDATQRLFNDELRRPSELGIVIGKEFEDTLMKGMAVLQKDRFHSMKELINSFKGVGTLVPSPTPIPAPIPVPAPAPKKKSAKGVVIGIVVTLILLGLLGGGYYLWYNGYFDSFLYDGADTTESTTDSTEPKIDEEIEIAKDRALRYVEAYFAPDAKTLDTLCELTYSDILEYNATEAGKTVGDYLYDEYGALNIDELYGMMDESDREDFAAQYGDDYSCTMSIVETAIYDDKQLESLINEAVEYCDTNYPGANFIDPEDITRACDVHIKYTITGSAQSAEDSAVVVMVYSGGEWLVLN